MGGVCLALAKRYYVNIEDCDFCYALGKAIYKQEYLRQNCKSKRVAKFLLFYNTLHSGAIIACNTWTLCATRLGVVRDIRRVVCELLLDDCTPWAHLYEKQKKKSKQKKKKQDKKMKQKRKKSKK